MTYATRRIIRNRPEGMIRAADLDAALERARRIVRGQPDVRGVDVLRRPDGRSHWDVVATVTA